MRRAAASLAALAIVPLAGSHLVPQDVAMRRSPAQVCAAAVKGFSRLPAPASLDDVVAGIDKAIPIAPSTPDLNNFPDVLRSKYVAAAQDIYGSALWLNPTGSDSGSLTQAITSGDGPLAAKLIAKLQRIYAVMDRAQKREKLPAACTSKAFGSAYFAQAAVVINKDLALTGNFTTDGNAACARLGTKIKAAERNVDITDISSVEDLVADADSAFRALQIDLRAITPPPESAQQYTALEKIIDQAVKKLDKAKDPSTSTAEFRRLGQELSNLATPVTAAATAVGLNC